MLTLSLNNYGLSRYSTSVVLTVSRGHWGQLNVCWAKVTDTALALCGNRILNPKSSAVNVNPMSLFSCLKMPGVWSSLVYSCSSSRSLSNLLARLPHYSSPYIPRIISQYTNPFFILSWSWYRSMNCWGINSMGILIYWWRSSVE